MKSEERKSKNLQARCGACRFLVLQRGFPLSGINFDSPGATRKNLPAERRGIFFGAPAGISPDGDKLRLPGSDRKKNPPPKGERFFLVLQRGFPLSGINFDSPGATRKNLPAERRGIFFGAPAGISPDGDKLRLPGSDRKKNPPPKGERFFLVLQRGFEPRTPCLKGRCSAY